MASGFSRVYVRGRADCDVRVSGCSPQGPLEGIIWFQTWPIARRGWQNPTSHSLQPYQITYPESSSSDKKPEALPPRPNRRFVAGVGVLLRLHPLLARARRYKVYVDDGNSLDTKDIFYLAEADFRKPEAFMSDAINLL